VIVDYVDHHRDDFGVEPICKVLEVAPSTYYAAKSRPPSARAVRDAVMIPILVTCRLVTDQQDAAIVARLPRSLGGLRAGQAGADDDERAVGTGGAHRQAPVGARSSRRDRGSSRSRPCRDEVMERRDNVGSPCWSCRKA
jgi:putative transposase